MIGLKRIEREMHTISNKWHQINKIITCIISSYHTFNMHLNVPICSSSGSDIEMKRLVPQRVQCLFSTPRFLFSHIIGWWWVEAQMQGMVGVPMMQNGHLSILSANRGTESGQ